MTIDKMIKLSRHPELDSGSLVIWRFRNKFGMTISKIIKLSRHPELDSGSYLIKRFQNEFA